MPSCYSKPLQQAHKIIQQKHEKKNVITHQYELPCPDYKTGIIRRQNYEYFEAPIILLNMYLGTLPEVPLFYFRKHFHRIPSSSMWARIEEADNMDKIRINM